MHRPSYQGFTLGWYAPPRWGGTDTTLGLLLEENVPKDPAKPWISNRQIYVGFGTVQTIEFAVRVVTLCQVLDEKPGVSRTLANQLLRSGTSLGAASTHNPF
jgi:hypothetical protein